MNDKTTVDEWEVRDLEDNSTLKIYVEHCTELGNQSKPGIQIWYTVGGGTYIVTFEPLIVERWAYQAKKEGKNVLLLEDKSWIYRTDTFVKNSLVLGDVLKARVELKVTSSDQVITKEYDLPFTV
jgi:hypothetical protein